MRTRRVTICMALVFGYIAALACARGAQSHQFGPTGLIGTLSKQTIKVAQVAEGSPAAGVIKVGDEIVGAGAARFEKDARRELAVAIDEAETKEAGGKLTLILKADRKVELKLAVLGRYSDTAPYKCP